MAHSFSYPHSFLSPMDALYRPVRRRRFGDDEYDGGYNPEARNYNGDDYGAFPLSKTITIGLNLTF